MWFNRRSVGAPSALRWRSVGAPSALRRSSVGAPSALRRLCVGAHSVLRQRSMSAPSARRRRSVGAPSALRRCCVGAPSTPPEHQRRPAQRLPTPAWPSRVRSRPKHPEWCSHPKLIHSTYRLKSVSLLAPAGPSAFNAYMALRSNFPMWGPRECCRGGGIASLSGSSG